MTLTPLMLFAGSRAGDFRVISGTMGEEAGGGAYDPAYSDVAVIMGAYSRIGGDFTNAAGAAFSVGAGKTLAIRAQIFETRFGQIVNGPFLNLYDSSAVPWLRVNSPNNGDVQLQGYNGSAWVNLGAALTVGLGGIFNVQVTIDAGGNHAVLFAVNGTTQYSGTFGSSGLTNLASFDIFNTDPGGACYVTEVMAAQDMNLVGARLKTLRATGAGTHSDWTGTYSDVNEAVTSDADFNKAASAGLLQSYAMTDVTVPTGYSIKGVVHRFRCKNGGFDPPANVKSLARSGGTDYQSPNLSGINPAYGYVSQRYDVDPATGVAWTEAGVNALELGFVSVT